jgi:hypothetical protein
MRKQQRANGGDTLRRLLQLPRLYVQFVRYQPSAVGTVIALIPAFLLLVAVALLVV